MRKAHMQVVIDGLQKRITDVERERDEARGALHEGLTKLHRKADDHLTALRKVSSDVGGLAEAVRTAVKPAAPEAPADAAEPATEAPAAATKPVTSITAKRGTKAAG
jgi:hypothetical protein